MTAQVPCGTRANQSAKVSKNNRSLCDSTRGFVDPIGLPYPREAKTGSPLGSAAARWLNGLLLRDGVQRFEFHEQAYSARLLSIFDERYTGIILPNPQLDCGEEGGRREEQA